MSYEKLPWGIPEQLALIKRSHFRDNASPGHSTRLEDCPECLLNWLEMRGYWPEDNPRPLRLDAPGPRIRPFWKIAAAKWRQRAKAAMDKDSSKTREINILARENKELWASNARLRRALQRK